MRALTYQGPRRLRTGHKPDPRVEHPDDVVLRVTLAAICGSDLHLYHGLIPDTRVGHTFGHEFVGVVEEVGSSVQNLRAGDRVVVPFNIACGTCVFCTRGLTSACESTNPNSGMMCGVYGYSHTAGGYDGGQAERVRVPYADFGPMKIPGDMTDEQVLFLSDILPTGFQAAEMADIHQGDTVAVFGAGPVGLFAAKSARLLGAGRVIVIDRDPGRLAFAAQFADAETIDPREVDPVLELSRRTEGRGPDASIDAVGCEASGSTMHGFLSGMMLESGNPAALEQCIAATRKGGTVSIVGVYGPPWTLVPIGTATNKGLTMRMGQCNVKGYMQRLLEHVREGRIDPTAIITHRVTLDEVPDAYETFARKQDGCIKCVVTPGRAAA